MKSLKDMIILLPGVMGSVLEHNGQSFWTISGGSLFNFIRSFGGNLDNLKLAGDDHTIDDLGDGIRATALMADTTIIPGFWKIDGYTKISEMIQTKFDVVKGDLNSQKAANYYEFYYDWRRDNRVAARRLQQLIERQLPIWRNHTGDQSAKVVLIAHSMGGIIARHYLEVEGGWQNSRMLITFGTPFRGSIKALNFLANGYRNWLVDLSEIVRSFTSSYQLLPIYKSVSVDGNFERVAEISNIPNVDSARAREGRAFLMAINDAAMTNRADQNYLENFSFVPIVGNEQTTLQSGKLVTQSSETKLEISNELPDTGLPKNGDGTVPFTSSVPIEVRIQDVRPFIEQHGALQNNSRVLEQVEFLLENLRTNATLTQTFGPGDNIGINLELEDLYFAKDPIVMNAKLINAVTFPSKLNAAFENIDDRTTHHGVFLPGAGKWKLEREPLPAGRYRVRVESDRVETKISPVHGLFEVAEA